VESASFADRGEHLVAANKVTIPKHEPANPVAGRDTVMVSHANPEDNEFTLWLALQLAKDGYKVWCDLIDLIGGEQFWSDIEYVIRNRAIKFVYILSRTSNESNRGFRKELHLADSEAKRINKDFPHFIIPVAIDNLPSDEYNIYVQQLNSVNAREWSNGLSDLLKRLRKDRVPRFQRQFNSGVISDWWRNFRSARAGIKRQPDQYLSNWFPIESIPEKIYWHTLESVDGAKPVLDFEMPFKFVQNDESILTFATDIEVAAKAGSNLRVAATDALNTAEVLNLEPPQSGSGPNLKFLLIELLRDTWDSWIGGRGLGSYRLANNRKCAFFIPGKDNLEPLRADFMGTDGKPAWRNLTGTFTRPIATTPDLRTQHYWHYGISARPHFWPSAVFHISAHVVFSDDGKHVWESKRRLHSARRRICKSWYNGEWRDRLIAAMTYLTGGASRIEIPLSETANLAISPCPVIFESKFTCTPIEKIQPQIEDTEPDDEEDEENDENGKNEGSF